jgi:hypothetical protein
MKTTIKFAELMNCIDVCEEAGPAGIELDPDDPDFDEKVQALEEPVHALLSPLANDRGEVTIEQLRKESLTYRIASNALSQAIYNAENPLVPLVAHETPEVPPNTQPAGKRIHRDQIRFHLEAMIEPYLEQLGAPNDEARERAQALLVETFMGSITTDPDGTVAVDHVILAASVNEFQAKALHRAAFSAFERLHAN